MARPKKNKEKLMIAVLLCIKDMEISGRIDVPEICFSKDKKYIFVQDRKRDEISTINEVGMMHILGLNDSFTFEHFHIVYMGDPSECGLSEFHIKSLQKTLESLDDYSLN